MSIREVIIFSALSQLLTPSTLFFFKVFCSVFYLVPRVGFSVVPTVYLHTKLEKFLSFLFLFRDSLVVKGMSFRLLVRMCLESSSYFLALELQPHYFTLISL